MNQIAPIRRILLIFLVLAVVLPISSVILFVTGWLFASFEETWGYSLFTGMAWIAGVAWVTDLVFLLLALAWNHYLTLDENE